MRLECATVTLEPETYILREQVVTTTRTDKTLEQLPVPSMVIPSYQIERIAPNTVEEIFLYALPGVELGYHGGVTSFSMQGLSAGYYTFLVDGEEVSGMKRGTPDFSRINPGEIERIEYVKGAGSSLYGSNAIGGVINIITKKGKAPFSLYANIGLSKYKQFNNNIGVGFSRDKWTNRSSASYSRNGGYSLSTKKETDIFSIFANTITSLSNRFTFRPNDRWRIGWDASGNMRLQEKSDYIHDRYSYFNNRIQLGYSVDAHNELLLSHNFDASFLDRIYPKVEDKSERKEFQYKNIKNALRAQYNILGRSFGDLNFGLEGYDEQINSFQIEQNKETKSIRNYVAFAQHIYDILPDLQVLYGVRADYNSMFGAHLSPKATLSYRLTDWRFRAGYAESFKAPEAMQLYYNWSHQGMFMIYGNPELKPETSRQLLAGVAWQKDRLSLSSNFLHTFFKDRIIQVQDADGNVRHINSDDRSQMTMVDAQLNWNPINGLTISGGYAFVHDPATREVDGKRYSTATQRPHAFNASVSWFKAWEKNSLSLNLMGAYYGAIKTNIFDEDEATKKITVTERKYGGFPTLRFSATDTFLSKYSITLGADNLINYKPDNIGYQNASFSPGIVLFGKLGIRL